MYTKKILRGKLRSGREEGRNRPGVGAKVAKEGGGGGGGRGRRWTGEREGDRKGGREGGKKRGRGEEREGGREGGREGRRKGGREVGKVGGKWSNEEKLNCLMPIWCDRAVTKRVVFFSFLVSQEFYPFCAHRGNRIDRTEKILMTIPATQSR